MQALFIIVALAGLAYFTLKLRVFDLFAVAYLSACIYFLPGFFGHALHPTAFTRVAVPLVDEAYAVMIAVLVAIVGVAVIMDSVIPNVSANVSIVDSGYTAHSALAIGIIGFVLSIATTGRALLFVEKADMLAALNRWHIVWVMGATLGAVIAYAERRRGILAACVVLLFFDLLIGFRVSFAISAICIFTLWLRGRGRQRLAFVSWRPFVAALGVALVIFVYKFVAEPIKQGDFREVATRLTTGSFYRHSIEESEPFGTQAILNEVIRSDFRVGTKHFSGLVYRLTFFAPEMGVKNESFNSMFQPALFPEHEAGMANNIWAEMWSAGGWGLLIVFIIFFAAIIGLFSRLVGKSGPAWAGGILVLGAYWAFYTHRNDLGYQFGLMRRVFLIWLASVVVSVILSRLAASAARSPTALRIERRSD